MESAAVKGSFSLASEAGGRTSFKPQPDFLLWSQQLPVWKSQHKHQYLTGLCDWPSPQSRRRISPGSDIWFESEFQTPAAALR